jgi:hypothetical protein
MNANRFFWDSHWLKIWSNHFYPSMGPNGGSVAMDSGCITFHHQQYVQWYMQGVSLPLPRQQHGPTLEGLCLDLLIVRKHEYNCIGYFTRQLTNNMYHMDGDPRMRKGCRAHIRRKVVVRDDSVVCSSVYPHPLPAVWTCRVYSFPPPAVWMCRVYSFPPPAEWTCRVYPKSEDNKEVISV